MTTHQHFRPSFVWQKFCHRPLTFENELIRPHTIIPQDRRSLELTSVLNFFENEHAPTLSYYKLFRLTRRVTPSTNCRLFAFKNRLLIIFLLFSSLLACFFLLFFFISLADLYCTVFWLSNVKSHSRGQSANAGCGRGRTIK